MKAIWVSDKKGKVQISSTGKMELFPLAEVYYVDGGSIIRIEAVAGLLKGNLSRCNKCTGEHPHGLAFGPVDTKVFSRGILQYLNPDDMREIVIKEFGLDPEENPIGGD